MSARYWSDGAAGPVLKAADRVDWSTRACNGADPELFFGPDGEPEADRQKRVAAASALCAACPLPVRQACLSGALAAEAGQGNSTRFGIYAGLGPRDRYKLDLRSRQRHTATNPALRRVGVQGRALPELPEKQLARFVSLIRPGGCGDTWAGKTDKRGNPDFQFGTGCLHVAPRRLVWKLATGTDPGSLLVWQRCGDRLCMTPECLTTDEPPARAA